VITRDAIIEIIAECMSIQMIDTPIAYETGLEIDSLGFLWMQHLLEERYSFEVQQPGCEVMCTLNSPKAVHAYLFEVGPHLVEPVE